MLEINNKSYKKSIFKNSLGIMQGRLSDPLANRIQSFPWDTWRREFKTCNQLEIRLLEWTIDSYNVKKNPIFIPKDIKEIRNLCSTFGVRIESVTCDFFMENPPWTAKTNIKKLRVLFEKLVQSSNDLESPLKLVVPLVDSGSLRNDSDFDLVIEALNIETLQESNCQVLFETDYSPYLFLKLLDSVAIPKLGVNLDTGNSASLGFIPQEEVLVLKSLIQNVHIKDRVKHGVSVPLGEGDAQLLDYLKLLAGTGYSGNFILQTARTKDGDHVGEIKRNINYLLDLVDKIEFDYE